MDNRANGTTYPAEIDTLPSIGPNDSEDAPGIEHDRMHDRANAILNAVMELLGTSNAQPSRSVLARLVELEAGGPVGQQTTNRIDANGDIRIDANGNLRITD